jgi:type II restriction enzyme
LGETGEGFAGLQAKHPENHNVKAKVRQQLQFLRDKGVIEFLAGLYPFEH